LFQPTSELGTNLINSKRALSCHLIYLWKSLARFGLFGGFCKVVGEGIGVTFGAMESKINKAVTGYQNYLEEKG
jgi:hypothetical protein